LTIYCLLKVSSSTRGLGTVGLIFNILRVAGSSSNILGLFDLIFLFLKALNYPKPLILLVSKKAESSSFMMISGNNFCCEKPFFLFVSNAGSNEFLSLFFGTSVVWYSMVLYEDGILDEAFKFVPTDARLDLESLVRSLFLVAL
jgi:hypothetical protein